MKEAIEEERKIQFELRMENLDMVMDKSVLNYIDPPVIKPD